MICRLSIFGFAELRQTNDKADSNPEVGFFLGIYFAFGVGSAALVVLQTLILWIFCSIEVSYTTCQLCGASGAPGPSTS